MLRSILLVFLAILGALFFMYKWVGVPTIYTEVFPSLPRPHLYQNPDIKIEDIRIAAFYFVPRNKTETSFTEWKKVLEENLKKLQEFHNLQFQQRSRLFYHIYPEPVIGFKENLFYDTDVTQHGNPEALKLVTTEIEGRIKDFPSAPPGSYRVILTMYEGVGASGSDNAALVSRTFFSDPRYSQVGASVMAHEFYHTLGIPDAYEPESSIPTSEDLMGLGRNRPLDKTYIERATLSLMGL